MLPQLNVNNAYHQAQTLHSLHNLSYAVVEYRAAAKPQVLSFTANGEASVPRPITLLSLKAVTFFTA